MKKINILIVGVSLLFSCNANAQTGKEVLQNTIAIQAGQIADLVDRVNALQTQIKFLSEAAKTKEDKKPASNPDTENK